MTKTILVILMFLLMFMLASCSANNTPADSATPPATSQPQTFAWPPFPTTQNVTTWYLWALAAATVIVGVEVGFKALLLAVLLVQFVTGLFLFLLVAVLTGLIYKGPKGPEYSFKAAAIAGAVIVIAESFMTMLAPGGTGVFVIELISGIIIFAIWRGVEVKVADDESTKTMIDPSGTRTQEGNRKKRTSVKLGQRPR